MAKQTDISSILKIVGKVLSDARFQECVTTIVSELLQQTTGNKGILPEKQTEETTAEAQQATAVTHIALGKTTLSDRLIIEDTDGTQSRGTDDKATLPAKKKLKRKQSNDADFAKYTSQSLRVMFYKIVARGDKIPAELNAELAKRFPSYDSATQSFIGTRGIEKNSETRCDKSLRRSYAYLKSQGKEIPAELNAELAKRFSRYDPTTQQFGEIDYTKSNNNSLRTMYSYRKRNNKIIPAKLNAELAKRFPNYDPEKQQFVETPLEKTDIAPTVAHKATEQTAPKAPETPVVATKAANTSKKTIEVSDQTLMNAYNMRRRACRAIGPELNAKLAERFPNYDPINQVFINEEKRTVKKPAKPAEPVELHVKLKERKLTLHEAYYDVIVNGQTILANHVTSKLCTYMDGALLAVHGIVTGDPTYPQKPIWLIFDTKLQPNRFVSRDKISGYRTYISSLQETSFDLRAMCSNKATVILSPEKYKRIANGARFIIEEKTK